MHSVAGTISRVATVSSLLKRFLSKDDKPESRPVSGAQNPETGMRLGTSASSASIAGGGKYPTQIGSMKISDQVIEEVDEQMTITSMRNKEDPRPTAQSLFTQIPTQSDPVDVPGRVPPPYERFISAQVHGMDENNALFPPGGVEDLLSSSAPAGTRLPASSSHLPETMQQFDPKQFGSQESEKSAPEEEIDSTAMPPDDFEKLRQEREAARNARHKEKMARSISAQQGMVNQIELQELLSEALTNNPRSTSGASSPTAEA
jgi:bestrophin, other